jgi:hypothetical protein
MYKIDLVRGVANIEAQCVNDTRGLLLTLLSRTSRWISQLDFAMDFAVGSHVSLLISLTPIFNSPYHAIPHHTALCFPCNCSFQYWKPPLYI